MLGQHLRLAQLRPPPKSPVWGFVLAAGGEDVAGRQKRSSEGGNQQEARGRTLPPSPATSPAQREVELLCYAAILSP